MAKKQFQVIVADCPWAFGDSLKMSDVPRGANANYSTMSISQIISLDVASVVDPNGCVLALWVPSSMLQAGMDTMKAWGFEQKQTYIWVKTKKEPFKILKRDLLKFLKLNIKYGVTVRAAVRTAIYDFRMDKILAFYMGRLFRQTHEICLIGTNSNKVYKELMNKSQRSVSLAPNLKHSAKPEDLQDSLSLMFPKATKLEMFARRERNGWTCLGNEVCDGEDITESLKKL